MMYEELCSKITEISGLPAVEVECQKGGIKKTGVTIGNGNLRPTIYPESIEASSTDELARKIIQIYENNKEPDGLSDLSQKLTEWDFCKDRLRLCVRPVTGNDAQITEKFLDLEKIVKVELTKGATVTVTKNLVKVWGVDAADVFENAKISPIQIMSMGQMLAEMTGQEVPVTDEAMYVVSNENRIDGASAITDNNVLKILAERFEEYFIIPSSIHELIIIPAKDGMSVDELKKMVAEVNDTQVAPDERLSYSVYEYKAGQLKIAA